MYLSKVCKNTTKGEPRSVVSLLVLGACFLSVSVRTIDSEPTAATAAVPETVSAPATVGSLFVVFFFCFRFFSAASIDSRSSHVTQRIFSVFMRARRIISSVCALSLHISRRRKRRSSFPVEAPSTSAKRSY